MAVALTDRQARAVWRALTGHGPASDDEQYLAAVVDKIAAGAFEVDPAPIPGQTSIEDYLEKGQAAA